MAVATNSELLKKALEAKATASPAGNPIVGTAGLLLGLAKFKKIDALCLLGETRGYLADPAAAKSVLENLQRIIGLEVDLSGLDSQILKAQELVAKMREIEDRRDSYARKMRRSEEERVTYIS
jgi:proteasome assembly chaperone (PAC2) family protein